MTGQRRSSAEDAAMLAGEPAEAAELPPPEHWVPPRRRWPTMVATALAAVIAILAILAMWRLPPFAAG